MKKLVMYSDAAGVVGFATRCPKGALPIGRVNADEIDGAQAHCRLAYDNRTWLVPGIPEAPDQMAGVAALERFRDRLLTLNIVTPI